MVESVAVMNFKNMTFDVASDFQPALRAKEWEVRLTHVPAVNARDQFLLVRVCEKKFETIKSAYESLIDRNIIEGIRLEAERHNPTLKSAFAKGVDFLKAKLSWDERQHPQKSYATLQQQNENIRNFINWETGKLLELKLHLYECSSFENVRQAMQTEVDDFIAQNLIDTPQGNELSLHDMLYLSHFGGAKLNEEDTYRFNAGDPLITVSSSKVRFLSELGLIAEAERETYKDNLSYAGRGVLKRMDKRKGPSIIAQYVSTAEELFPEPAPE